MFSLSRFFIERPVFAAVLSIIIAILGLLGLYSLPVQQYPNIAPVQITVSASYPGADAQTASQSVAAPIEQQIIGVDNLLYLTSSSSSSGNISIQAYFKQDADPDIAQVQVQNRVSLATPQLPSVVNQYGVTVNKRSSSILMVVNFYDPSGKMSALDLSNYVTMNVLDTIKRIPGAGQASQFGSSNQAIRIWMDPRKMASLGVTTTDIKNAIASQNALVGAGQIGQEPSNNQVELTIPVVAAGAFADPRVYENMVIRAAQGNNALVQVKDVARVELGQQNYQGQNFVNGKPASTVAVYLQAGANSLEVADQVRATLKTLKAGFPPGMDYLVALDTTTYVRDSISEVTKTLIEALALVLVIMYLFLQNLRATFIATIAIGVSLLGSFIGLALLGFSVNLLTLFGLVLAIGLVVDDAIVVIENVERVMHDNPDMPVREAAIESMREVSSAVFGMTLVLSSVFIPALFMSGTTGELYKQFAATIAGGVIVSGITALTLTPTLCAMLLKRSEPHTRGPFAWFNNWFARLTRGYGRLSHLVIRRSLVSVLFLGVMLLGVWQLFRIVPTSFVPQEDQGYLFAALMLPESSSMPRTIKAADQLDRIIRRNQAVEANTIIDGFSLLDGQNKSSVATAFINLKPSGERTKPGESAFAVLEDIARQTHAFTAGMVIPLIPPPIPGIGTQAGFDMWVQSRGTDSPAQIQQNVQKFIAAASKEPAIGTLRTSFNANTLQLKVDIDRVKANLIGADISDVLGTLQAQLGSLRVSQFNQYSRVWDVTIQSESDYRQRPEDIGLLYTRTAQGNMVPLSSVVNSSFSSGPTVMSQYNGVPAANVTGTPASGYSSGEAIAALERVATDVLPASYSYGWAGLTYTEVSSGNDSVFIFGLGLLMVFLILAVLFESWTLPTAVLAAVPFGLLGALLATWLRGLDNDVYMQIGLLVLVGLAAKNAILIVEFAVQLHKDGKSLLEAAVDAGELRLRAIIMTSLAFIFGTLPLALATGSGANARHSIGTGIVGGMIVLSSLALLFVPMFFYHFERWREGRQKPQAVAGEPPAGDDEEDRS
ncbi:efflux RND transporter permease subunit [Laribacter hongkongensis]|uniref:Efflux pump membrane transporter n=3 Tax=Laribacter hongkongensis TaxID=168471 RepID=A0A248LJ76_9NEIS|nr:multidrug efflux RND transporter permease subunit [Laribacter hongkongensis]ASJ24514.1 cation/multidrug efflux pump [Laribacter hongkongensis]MCG9030776.1 multidrug efflux RND transporter permease subunit [Laribacter hongkongensis]MCG9040322.1 multidrug efflux RND transporter permease subunit [Laribacter hongkongensis]MCG9067408.1 multidrug efflux RND transporter permease subunit [Laribacter hongkongensis]MCG9090887.1 multidrug efflux RND transporter permease subunit [Laribacter hongkongens